MATLHSLIAQRRFGPPTQWRPLRKTLTSWLRELILVFLVHLFDLCLFGFVGFLFLLVSGKGCGLWLWHSLHFSLTFFGGLMIWWYVSGLARRGSTIGFHLAYGRITHEYSSLFIIVINLIFMFSLWCIDWVGSLYANRMFMYFCIKSSIGTQVKLASCKSAWTLPPPTPTRTTPPHPTPRPHCTWWFTLLTVLRLVPVLVLLYVALWFILRGDLFYVLLCVIFAVVFFSPFSIAITSLGEEAANLSVFRTFVRFVLVWFCRFPLPVGVWEGLRFVIVALPGLFSYLFFL